MAKGNKLPPNICFDCKNAYAHKCKYIGAKNSSKIIRECLNYEPDFVAKGAHAIAKILDIPINKFCILPLPVLESVAEEKGYILYKDGGYRLRKAEREDI